MCLGIRLANNVFARHGVDEVGQPALALPTVSSARLMRAISALPPCLIAMDACSGAPHWAREFHRLGNTVKLIVPGSPSAKARRAGGGIKMPPMPLPFAKPHSDAACTSRLLRACAPLQR